MADSGSQRYVYMPLNYEPESAIDVQSGFYRDQLAVVRRVAAAVPAGYALVVKEHPNMNSIKRRAALFLRVSTGRQETENQRPDLLRLAQVRGGLLSDALVQPVDALSCGVGHG